MGVDDAALQAASANLAKVINESAIGLPARDALDIAGVVLVNEIKQQLSHPGSGEVYVHGGVEHQASAPGEPPAVDTGQLRNSISSTSGEDASGPYVDVGTNLEKAGYLEFGTSTIEPRPFMRPAIESATPKMAQALADGITRAQRIALAKMPRAIELPS